MICKSRYVERGISNFYKLEKTVNNRPYDYDKAKAQVRGQLHVIVAYNSINGLLEIGIGNKKNAESMEKMIERNRRLG